MEIKFKCRYCKSKLSAEDSFYGTLIQCPGCNNQIKVPVPRFEVGEKLDNYEIEQWLGKGAMGEVYLARQVAMQRLVAIKVHRLPIDELTEEEKQEFITEIRTLAKLSHPNIVTAFEAGEAKGSYYLAMSYVQGESLEEYLILNGSFEEKHAIKICLEVAKALKYAWERLQLLHRDIKPANIMIDESGNVKLMDLGIAIRFGEEEDEDTIVGSPYYMSPEQARFDAVPDERSDIYSLGATLYHMLTNSEPYHGFGAEEIIRLKQEADPEWPQDINPDISDETAELIMHMMEFEPDDRPQDWDEVIELLNRSLRPKKKRKPQPKRDISYDDRRISNSIRRHNTVKKRGGFSIFTCFIIGLFLAIAAAGIIIAAALVYSGKGIQINTGEVIEEPAD